MDDIKAKYDHAWRYFELHANQRISLIRYYVTILSLYVTASGYLIIKFPRMGNTEEILMIFISTIFILISIIFWLLDSRNRKLIHNAEDSLRELEKEDLSIVPLNRIFTREKKYKSCTVKHTQCFRALFIIAIISAFILIIYSIVHIKIPNIYFIEITHVIKNKLQ